MWSLCPDAGADCFIVEHHGTESSDELQSELHCSEIRLLTAPLRSLGSPFEAAHVRGQQFGSKNASAPYVALFAHAGLKLVAAAFGKQMWQIGIRNSWTDSFPLSVYSDIDGILTLFLVPLIASALSSFGGL